MNKGMYGKPEPDENDKNRDKGRRTQRNKHLMVLRRLRRRRKPGDTTGGGPWKRRK